MPNHLPDVLLDQIEDEILRAIHDHGELTNDVDHAFVIMGEEFGEVAKAILEYGRAKRVILTDGRSAEETKRLYKQNIRTEAIQLTSLLVLLIGKIDRNEI